MGELTCLCGLSASCSKALWVALLVHVVLSFPDGRPWSRAAGVAIAGAYVATIGGQLLGAFVFPTRGTCSPLCRSRLWPTPSTERREYSALPSLWRRSSCSARRLLALRGPARRAQAPLLVAAGLTIPATVLWLVWVERYRRERSDARDNRSGVFLLVPLGVVAGIVWSRLRRREASDLVVELRTEAAASMRERLAEVLGDPSLEVAYRLDDGRYVDAAGQPFELPQDASRAITLVTAHGDEIAALVHDPALLDEPALVESVRATAGSCSRTSAWRPRCAPNSPRCGHHAPGSSPRRTPSAGDSSAISTTALSSGWSRSPSPWGSRPRVVTQPSSDVLSRAQDEVEEAIAELRELARGIHPTLLRDEGLEAAVEALARRTPLPVTVEGSVGTRLPDAVELAAYFLVSEALTNVVKHASASEAKVRIEREADMLCVVVADNGVGGAHAAPDSGLAGLRDRLEALDATLVVESEPGRGTTYQRRDPMRIVIADDAVLIREGVARVLTESGLEVVGQVGDADGLLASVRGERPDVALVDIRMPPSYTDEGLRAARTIRSQYPETAVLVLSQHLEPTYALQLVEQKPERVGYLLKERVGRVEQLLDAVERVAAGECVVDRAVVDELLAQRGQIDPLAELTPREREIIALMAEGRSNQGICRALWLSPKTVETHIRSAFAKLGIKEASEDNRRVLAVLTYLRR